MKIRLPLAPAIGVCLYGGVSRFRLFREADVGMMVPMRIVDEVRSDSEQIISSMSFAFMRHAGTKETIVGFLQQVFGQLRVSRSAPQIDPDRSGGPLIESLESLLVHLKPVVEGLRL